ncbi:tetratricopeptide repeat protein [Kitasatospora sp. NPDC059571]|uniref:tetratricopeptide repeat protein n=1 Tax=Kitasatospora sp. NPDC059571 TaxID=3346871 RepID=UPI0036D060A5
MPPTEEPAGRFGPVTGPAAPAAPAVPPQDPRGPARPLPADAALPEDFPLPAPAAPPVPASPPAAPAAPPAAADAPAAVRELLLRLRDRAPEAPTPDGAGHLLESVAREMTALLGRYDRDTLAAWRQLGTVRLAAGDAAGAVHLLGQVAADAVQALGPGDPDTLQIRTEHARALGDAGDTYGALNLLREVQPALVQAVGAYDARALAGQTGLARAVARSGDTAAAVGMLLELVPVVQQHLGPDHPLLGEARCELGRLVPAWRRLAGGAGLPVVAAVAMVHRLLVWDFASDREADLFLTELERATGHRDLAGRLAAVPDEMPAEQATTLLLGPA